jgi:hypothetical protein
MSLLEFVPNEVTWVSDRQLGACDKACKEANSGHPKYGLRAGSREETSISLPVDKTDFISIISSCQCFLALQIQCASLAHFLHPTNNTQTGLAAVMAFLGSS